MMKYFPFILFVLLISSAEKLIGQTIEVCATCEYTSIKKAIENAEAGSTILIKNGIYKEHDIAITKTLNIMGEKNAIIDGQKKGEIIRVMADNVTIDGLTLANVGTSFTTDYAALRVVKSENFLLQNLILKKLFFGIYLEKSNNGKVLNNTIIGDAVNEYNSGNGIQLWYSKNIEVAGNTVRKVRDGMYLEFSDEINIHHNKSFDNLRYGLHFMFSNNDVYSHNIFENNGAGVAVMFSKFIKM